MTAGQGPGLPGASPGPPGASPRPLIGLTTYREQARWGVWDASADLLPTTYAAAVEAVDGVPVLLPPMQLPAGGSGGHTAAEATLGEAAASVVRRLDGLIVCGGADVSPERYAQAPHPRTVLWRDDRDAWELALLDAAEVVALPTLGVCRGMQVMAVRAGGVLEQHVPDVVAHERHNPGGDAFGDILVRTEPGSRIGSLVGSELSVHCHHHQSVSVHPGFAATAWADDGTLEAMEQPGDRFCIAVQWHPEMTHDRGLFAALVHAARQTASSAH